MTAFFPSRCLYSAPLLGATMEISVLTTYDLLDVIVTHYYVQYGGQLLRDVRMTSRAKPQSHQITTVTSTCFML